MVCVFLLYLNMSDFFVILEHVVYYVRKLWVDLNLLL